MIRRNPHDSEDLRREGLRALHDRLGAADAVRFLREFSSGYGDYTAERSGWLGKWTAQDMEAAMRDAAKDPLLAAAQELHQTLSQLTPYYAEATPENQHLVRELVSFVVSRYRQQPIAAAPLPKAPEGYAIAFSPDSFVTIEPRKSKHGVKLRLSGTLESLRAHGAPEGMKAKEHPSFVRVEVDGLGQLGLARAWIAAAAKLRELTTGE